MITSITPMVGGRCPLCGADHAACGQPSTTTPVDLPAREERHMGPTRKYRVTTPSGVRTVMKLNEEDAKNYPDAEPVDQPTAAAGDETDAKSRQPANKARKATNKTADAAD